MCHDQKPMSKRAGTQELFYTCHWVHPLNLHNTPQRYYHFPHYIEQEPKTREIKELAQGHTANGKAGLSLQQTDSGGWTLPYNMRHPQQGTPLRKVQSPWGAQCPSSSLPFLSPGLGSISSGCKHLLIIFTKHFIKAPDSSPKMWSDYENLWLVLERQFHNNGKKSGIPKE